MKQSIDSKRAIALLTRQKDAIGDVAKLRYDNEAGFTRWRRDTSVAIEKIFGSESRHLSDFDAVRYSLMAFTTGTGDHEFQAAYVRGLQRVDAILSSMIQELQDFSLDLDEESSASDALSTLELICRRFHAVARQLRARRSGRATLNVEDEYDVQDLLHALLRLHFEDIRPEEWTPSYAGGAARMDFLLKKEQIVIETKRTRKSLTDADLGAELLVDIARYEGHPDCKILVCFVYDPEARIGNPAGLVRDLEASKGGLKVRAIIAPH